MKRLSITSKIRLGIASLAIARVIDGVQGANNEASDAADRMATRIAASGDEQARGVARIGTAISKIGAVTRNNVSTASDYPARAHRMTA